MSKNKKRLFIVIGCDTDPDRQSIIDDLPGDRLSWRGMTEGIPETKSAVAHITDSDGKSPVFTWLFRVDEQIKILYGAYNWVLENYKTFIEDLESAGDEIGWHPHFYKPDDEHRIWYQELEDVIWQCAMLESGFKSFNEIFPGRPESVRMGWIYHNNETMKKLNELGIKIDFSAVPRLRTDFKNKLKFPYNIYDWYSTGSDIYRPSKADYRRAAKKGESALSILEVPNFISTSWFWGMVSGLQMARKMRNPMQIFLTLRKPAYWVNLTASPKLYSTLIDSLRKRLKKSKESDIFFVTYFHPDELIQNKSIIYSRENLARNLKSIVDLSDSFAIPVRYIRAGDIPSLVDI